MKMSLSSSKDVKDSVRVICDFTYTPKDSTDPVSISVGEEYWLINKTNSNWWFVQKKKSKTQLFIPAQYVEVLKKGGRPAENNALTNGNPVTKPKPERITSDVTGKDEAKERSMMKTLENETLPLPQGKPLYENVVLTSQQSRKVAEKVAGRVTENVAERSPVPATVKQPFRKDNDVDIKVGTLSGSRTERKSEEKQARSNTSESVDVAEGIAEKSAAESARRNETRAEASLVADATASEAEFFKGKAGHVTRVALDNHQQKAKDRVAVGFVSTDNSEESSIANGIEVKNDVEKPAMISTLKQELPLKTGKAGGLDMMSSEYANLEDLQRSFQFPPSRLRDVINGNPEKSSEFKVPLGWSVEEEEGEKTFVNNNSKGEKWRTAFDETGRQYFYSLLTNQTVWNLSEVCTLAPKRKAVSLYKSSSARQHLTESAKLSSSSSRSSGVKHPAWPSSRLVIKHLAQVQKLEAKASESSKGSHSIEGRIDSDFDREVPHLEPLPLKMVQKQGPLSKAKVDDQGKKAKKPSWSQSYAVLVENILYFYKDMKVAASAKAKSISSLGKPELTLQLDNANLSSSPDEKRKEVLTLSLSTGVVYHLHHDDEDVLKHWRQSLENNIEAIKTTPTTASCSSKEFETLPIRPELSRMCSISSIISEERIKIADRLLHWFKRRPSLEVLQLKGIIKDAVFGSSLTAICEREKTKIPRFVHACLAAVEKRGLDVDGIYRISGNMSLVQKLRHIVDQNEFYDLLCPTWDVHTITGALKLFFRELSEPVFTFALFDKFLDAYRITDPAQKISAYRDVISRLPPFHAETMKRLFKHLTEVIRHGSANRMQSQALAIVFGPTLLWPESKSKDVTLAASMVYQGQVVEFMILEFKHIFS